MRTAQFYTHMPDANGIGNYQFAGVDIRDPKMNEEFNDYVNGTYLYSHKYTEKLKTMLVSAALKGQAPAYKFLSDMPEDDALEWIEHSMRQLRRAYKKDPDNNQPIGILPTLDRLRAQRKANRKPKKVKEEAN